MVQNRRMNFQTAGKVKNVGRSATTGRFVATKASGAPHDSLKMKRPTIIEAAERAEKRLRGSMRILA